MRKADIIAGAECYYINHNGGDWRIFPPQKATIVDTQPVQIGHYGGWRPHPDGTGIVVDLHELRGVRRTAVYRRHLRGLWTETLAATGRTEAGVLAHNEGLKAISRGDVDLVDGLLQLAARDPMDDGTFTALAQALDGRHIS